MPAVSEVVELVVYTNTYPLLTFNVLWSFVSGRMIARFANSIVNRKAERFLCFHPEVGGRPNRIAPLPVLEGAEDFQSPLIGPLRQRPHFLHHLLLDGTQRPHVNRPASDGVTTIPRRASIARFPNTIVVHGPRGDAYERLLER